VPYKDPKQKEEWERRNRLQRLARRRELRRKSALGSPTQPVAVGTANEDGFPSWPLLVGGGALASYSPAIGLGAGSLTLILAALRRSNWRWWIVGAFILAVAVLFLWDGRDDEK
jgi:hypothetical protein